MPDLSDVEMVRSNCHGERWTRNLSLICRALIFWVITIEELGIANGEKMPLEFPNIRRARASEVSTGHRNVNELKSLVFVFDVTGSMTDDWEGAINGGKRILEAFLHYEKRPVSNYVLVPFSDPEFGPATTTEDPDVFIESLKSFVLGGGGDCPEKSLSAIKEALETAHPYSYIYVFTDASAKDYSIGDEVVELIERKHSQVVFFITGHCHDIDTPAFQVYERIAAASFGQLYYLLKSNIAEILQSVLITTKPNKSNLLVVSSPELDPSNSVKYNISVESDLEKLIVQVTGDSPEVDIRNPLGNPPDKINIPFDLPKNKFIEIDHPKPAGNWVLKVTFHPKEDGRTTFNTTMITVEGLGASFDIKHGFSLIPVKFLSDTASSPLEAARNYVYMEIHPNNRTLENEEKLQKYKWKTMDIMRRNGTVYFGVPLSLIFRERGEEIFPIKYLASPFIPPKEDFSLAFLGEDEKGNTVKRFTPNSIFPREARPPYVQIDQPEDAILGYDFVLKCEVQSLIEFSVQWYKDDRPIMKKENILESSGASLFIPKIKKENEGKYRCEATNIKGSDSKETVVTVFALPVIYGLDNDQLFILKGKSAVLNCDATSETPYDIAWMTKKNGRLGLIDYNTRSNIQMLKNNSLSLLSLKSDDSGTYVCRATNRAGTVIKAIEIIVSPLEITTSPSDQFEFQEGEMINIVCNVITNIHTKIHWELNGSKVSMVKDTSTNVSVPLVVPSANRKWEGIYKCVAENDIGRVEKELKGIRIVLPVIKAIKPFVAVKLGNPVTLICSITGETIPEIAWIKEGNILENGAKYQISSDKSSLYISHVEPADEGNYKCLAYGPRNYETFAEIKLRVGYPPKPKQKHYSESLEVENEGLYPCEAEKDLEEDLYPEMKTKVFWDKENGTLDMKRQKVLNSGDLKIKDAKPNDEGLYVCILRNAFGDSKVLLDLKITGAIPPKIEGAHTEQKQFKRGDTIVLWCNATGKPQPELFWVFKSNITAEFEDGYEEENIIKVSGPKLTLYKTIVSYQGNYSCTAKNGDRIPSDTKTYILSFKDRPILLGNGKPIKHTITEGDSYVLRCDIIGTPKPSFKWIKDRGNAIRRNVTDHYSLENENSILRIPSAVPGYHDGLYRCIAVNEIGKVSRVYKINVAKKVV